MAPCYRCAWFCLYLALFALRARADCTVTGIDYTNGGSYLIDSSSDQEFAFTSLFQGCDEDTIEPILIAPDGEEYNCTTIDSGADDPEQRSTCPVTFNSMASGEWTIIIQGDNVDLAVQRSFMLNAGVPEKTVITLTPTVVVGVTSTPPAKTSETTITDTETIINAPTSTAAQCSSVRSTETVTQYLSQAHTTVYMTVRRITTVGAVTSQAVTTLGVQASCHWPQGGPPATSQDSPPPQPTEPRPPGCDQDCRPIFNNGGWGWGRGHGHGHGPGHGGGRHGGGGHRGGGGRGGGHRGGGRGGHPDGTDSQADDVAADKRALGGVAAVTTSTVYGTSTVTSTSFLTARPSTTVETSYVTVRHTITAPAQTVCAAVQAQTLTVVSIMPQQTRTEVTYVTVSTQATVWVAQTQYTTNTDFNVASACWQGGGWYGA